MAAQQGIKTYSPGRIALKNVFLLIPAVVIMAVTLNTVSCGNSGLLTPVNSGSNTPTATPTTGTGALAFVTNFNDGMVSSFTRNITTGVLKLRSQVTAGAKRGPKGVVAAPSGSFLYVANNADNKIYQFSINPTNGTLTPLSPASVSNGSGSAPDEIAINTAGTFLWVTGAGNGHAGNGTVTTYAINSSTGQLTNKGSVKGFTSPFGIAVDSTQFVCLRRGPRGRIGLLVLDWHRRRSQHSRIADPRPRRIERQPRLHRDRSFRHIHLRHGSHWPEYCR